MVHSWGRTSQILKNDLTSWPCGFDKPAGCSETASVLIVASDICLCEYRGHARELKCSTCRSCSWLVGRGRDELRWDVFNVFNTVNYALPNNVIGGSSTDFGKITDSVGGPRVMQLGARVRF